MTAAATKYRDALDRILANPDLAPKGQATDDQSDDATVCNIGLQLVAEEYGYLNFHKLLANQIMALIEAEARKHAAWLEWVAGVDKGRPKPERGDWCECDGKSAAFSASIGVLTVAACYGEPIKKAGKVIGRGHGHVAAVYPSHQAMLYSVKWDKDVPVVASIGKRNGTMGANYAFKKEPRYFIFTKGLEEKRGETS